MQIFRAGHADIDQALQGLVDLFEARFPSRIRGYYVEGSYADQTSLDTSDIDLIVLFKHAFIGSTERASAEQMAEDYAVATRVEFDIAFFDENQMAAGVPPSLKLGSTLLFGEPLPDVLPLVSLTEWGRERMHAAYWLMTKVFGRPDFVTLPRDYPQPRAEFYGYTKRKVRLANGTEADSTRDLIRVMGWAGTALVAYLGRQMVARKKECHVLYRKHVSDEWASLLESIYQQCREQWHYLIPQADRERRQLRALCRRALAFENHFLHIYKQFVLSELCSADVHAQTHALWVQAEIPFIDEEIVSLVREIAAASGDTSQ